VLFTYNPVFILTVKRGKIPEAKRARLLSLLPQYDIAENRVIVLEQAHGKHASYVAERFELVQRFFQLYPLQADLHDHYILSDNGNSFKVNEESGLHTFGFRKHVFYPAPVHQYLSPNDNRLHGSAKQAWRRSGVDFKDDVLSCLRLLHFLDRDTIAHSKKWFERNMLKVSVMKRNVLDKRHVEVAKDLRNEYLHYMDLPEIL
jgi:hypothetical protein